MTKLLQAAVLTYAVAALLPFGIASAQELEPIGALPRLGVEWELNVEDQQSNVEAKSPFRWAVFRNKGTGDFLSFATHPGWKNINNINLEYLSDTSKEIFPNGRAVWTQSTLNGTSHAIAFEVVDIRHKNALFNGEKVLEYCFISESPDRDNLMAQGRAWIGPKGVVFAQHTSAKPITSELVDQAIRSIIQGQRKLAASTTR
ncbi:hypothetical protein Poly51_49130 [Rubripirellula tenax]|uniref:Methanolan biosynthesis EpsI domain-containing protein n=1 Tax=Rubripirellula tenax TaxID=2528015 RepID=A0A5C6ENS0_9BACT|nr:hypothetical protein [Rubripirellula tenax]TWU49009.1 hypothetical protein Poly51_49130 [Rubripirellula tenax]